LLLFFNLLPDIVRQINCDSRHGSFTPQATSSAAFVRRAESGELSPSVGHRQWLPVQSAAVAMYFVHAGIKIPEAAGRGASSDISGFPLPRGIAEEELPAMPRRHLCPPANRPPPLLPLCHSTIQILPLSVQRQWQKGEQHK
jgi:hypothetical protein